MGAFLDLAACRIRPSGPIDRAAVAPAGYEVVKMEGGSDGSITAIVAGDDVTAIGRLVTDLAPDITILRSLITAGRSPAEAAPVKLCSKTFASAR